MKTSLCVLTLFSIALSSCSGSGPGAPGAAPPAPAVKTDTPPPPLDPNNIVSIAAGS
ncbi:MAG: hypothetical protein Q7T30_00840 [Planctomycetota bacterium]|nr:hypothetical protein [Planctomycetota bacterium]